MTRWSSFGIAMLCSIGFALCARNAGAQQQSKSAVQDSRRYDVAREMSVQGTVVSYTESLWDARVVLQTSAGLLDAHLGNAKLLRSNHVTLSAGDTLRAIGENVKTPAGTQFLARILIKGNQQVALRTVRGIPFVSSRPSTAGKQANAPQGGVL